MEQGAVDSAVPPRLRDGRVGRDEAALRRRHADYRAVVKKEFDTIRG